MFTAKRRSPINSSALAWKLVEKIRARAIPEDRCWNYRLQDDDSKWLAWWVTDFAAPRQTIRACTAAPRNTSNGFTTRPQCRPHLDWCWLREKSRVILLDDNKDLNLFHTRLAWNLLLCNQTERPFLSDWYINHRVILKYKSKFGTARPLLGETNGMRFAREWKQVVCVHPRKANRMMKVVQKRSRKRSRSN